MNNDNLNLNLLNGGSPFIKKKKRSPQKKKTYLSKEYKVFLKKSLAKSNDDKKQTEEKKPDVEEKKPNDDKDSVIKNTPSEVVQKPTKPTSIKTGEKKYVKIVNRIVFKFNFCVKSS